MSTNTPARNPFWLVPLLFVYTTLCQHPFPRVFADKCDRERQGTIQTIAGGTQDLAALVGLFATDSVERYSVDYSKGYLSVAVATSSLLGILGFVRALVKLGMGSKWCQDAAFPTAPVRSILGVAQTDRMPKEELVTTTYITRQIVTDKSQAEIWQYKLQKQHDHTLDSFPSAALLNDTVAALSVIKQNKKRNTYLLLGKVWISLAITSAATSFPVLMIAPRVLTWARIIASYGLFIALAGSSIMWSQIYMREQLSTTYRYNIPLFSTLNRFAAIRSKSGPFRALIADLRTLDSRHENICRFISFFSAAVICLGYICQYVEITNSSKSECAWWLGSQTTLAAVRVVIWIWNPKFDDFHYGKPIPFFPLKPFEPMFLAVLNFTTVPISNSPPASRTMDFPAALFGRLQNHQQINKILADTISIVKNENIPEELFQRGLHTRIKNIWEFPEGRAQTWLECLGPDTLDARFDQACKDCHFIIVQIGGDNGAQPWVDGNIYLFPLVESFLGSAKDGRIVHTLFTPNPLMERIGVTRLPGVNHDQLAIEEFKEALQMDSPMALEMIGVVLELVHKTMSIVIATAGASDSNTAPEPVPQSGPASNEFVIEMEPAVYGARAEQKL